jgi:uncharacterized protein YggT (Ycf19 family)
MPATQPDPADDAGIGLLRVGKGIVLFVYVVVVVNLVLLVLGFLLQLFGASTDAAFTQWVYRNVERVMEPFRGMFPAHALSDQSVLDVSLLFAMIVYLVVGLALHALIVWFTDKIATLRRREAAVSPGGRSPAHAAAGQPGGPAAPWVGPPAATPGARWTGYDDAGP